MRNGETHGLLIGPHSSNLLSEVILTVVDKILYDKGYRFVRNIDDYDCYVGSQDDAKLFLRDLEEILREFDLPLDIGTVYSEHFVNNRSKPLTNKNLLF